MLVGCYEVDIPDPKSKQVVSGPIKVQQFTGVGLPFITVIAHLNAFQYRMMKYNRIAVDIIATYRW
jgi:hypothetical protein